MTKPAWKAPKIRNFLDDLSRGVYERSASEAIQNDTCVRCNRPATVFVDEVSRREFAISGLCQKCQDIVFAPPPEEE